MPRIARANELLIANADPAVVWGQLFAVDVPDSAIHALTRLREFDREQILWAMFQWYDAGYDKNIYNFLNALREGGEDIQQFIEDNLVVARCESVYRLTELRGGRGGERLQELRNEVRTNLDFYYDLETDWAVSESSEPHLQAAVQAMQTILGEDL